LENARKVLDRFILEGEQSVMDIMKFMLRSKEGELVKMDCWDIQVYLGKKIYETCINDNTFFPPYNSRREQVSYKHNATPT